jgi:hypothetical protein
MTGSKYRLVHCVGFNTREVQEHFDDMVKNGMRYVGMTSRTLFQNGAWNTRNYEVWEWVEDA